MSYQIDLSYFQEELVLEEGLEKNREQKIYNFERDLQNEVFEKIFADDYLGDKYELTEGYSPRYDLQDLVTEETYEVKRDYWWVTTDNILIEEYYHLEEGKKGWIYHTDADFLVVFVTDEIYYITNMYKLKADFFNNKDSWVCSDILQPKSEKFQTKSGEPHHTRNWLKNYKNFDCHFYKVDPKALIAGGTQKSTGN